MRPSRRSHLVHPLPSRTYDAEQSTQCPPLDKQCSSAIIISTTVICRLKYPNRRPWQLQLRVTSVDHGVLWSAGPDDHLRRGGPWRRHLVRPLWLLVLRVCGKCGGSIKWPSLHWLSWCRRATRRADGHGGLRQRYLDSGRVRLPADADPQEFLRSADWRGRLAPENSRTRTDADHLLKLGTRQADLLSTVSRCYSIVLTDALYLSHPPWPRAAAAAVNCSSSSVTQPARFRWIGDTAAAGGLCGVWDCRL